MQNTARTPSVTGPHRGFAVLCGAQFLLILDIAVVNVALPRIQTDLGFSESALQLVITAYTLTFGGLLLLGGRAADVLGRRRMFVLGLVVFTAGSLACGLAPSAAVLVVARAVQGVGAALASPAALALLAVLYPDARARARALGTWSALAAAGGAAGLLLGGVLTQLAGWRYIFLLNIVGVALVLAAPRVLPEPARTEGKVDAVGAVLVTGGVVAVVYGVTSSGTAGFTSAAVVGALLAAVLLVGAFLVLQARVAAPLLPLTLFRSRSLTGGNLAAALMSPVVVGVNYFLTLHLQTVGGLGPLQTGLAFLPLTVVSAVSSIAAGRLAGRLGTRTVLVAGLLLIAAGAGLLTRLGADSAYATTVLPALLLVAVGLGPGFTLTTLAATTDVPDDQQGAAAGLLSTSQQLGGAIGLAVLSVVAASSTTTSGSGGDTSPNGYAAAFTVMTVLAAAAAVAVALLVRSPRQPARAGRGGAAPVALHPYPVPATAGSPTLPCQPAALLAPARSPSAIQEDS